MRNTRHPLLRSVRVTKRSRAIFFSSLLRQKAALFFGFVPCFGHPVPKRKGTAENSSRVGLFCFVIHSFLTTLRPVSFLK